MPRLLQESRIRINLIGFCSRIEYFVIHDIRRTVRTRLARLKVPEVMAELILGHALRGVVGTYNIYDFDVEKRSALEEWTVELSTATRFGRQG